MSFCPRCQQELIEGAHACALCGFTLADRPRRTPSLKPLLWGAAAGLGAGFVLGLRCGGYAAGIVAPLGGCAGALLGLLVGAIFALRRTRRSR
jgi:hypothetical protein